jgi:hypothetical protein
VGASDACILELRARVEALEAVAHKHIVETSANILALASRVDALEAGKRSASKVYEISKPLKLTPDQVEQVLDQLRPTSKRTPSPSPEPITAMSDFHPAPFDDFSTELRDPWPVVERLRMALREAERYCLGAENTTGHCITSLLEILPNEDD